MCGVIIAGTHSGCGKTTVTLGLLAALREKGLKVQSFKAGPDFIDSGLHRLITGRPSRNLDLWMCGEGYVRQCFTRYSAEADVSVVEGAMGLHDGNPGTAHLAEVLNLPIVLVVDAYGMAESAGAVVKGYAEYGKNHLDGVIFNRVSSENHYRRLKAGIRDVPVLGYLPRDLEIEIPHRHLGLVVAEENPLSGKSIKRLARAVLENVDIEALVKSCATEASKHQYPGASTPGTSGYPDAPVPGHSAARAKIALAYDRAFCFYYEDNFDLLKSCGAEVVRFSPLADPRIPDDADAVYIGGGYPELHAAELARNGSMQESIRDWAQANKPLYAECGGLMYLSTGVRDFDGTLFEMCGVFPFETEMRKGRAKLGYRELQLNDECLLGKKGARLRGHEFHYSEIRADLRSEGPSLSGIYTVRDGEGREKGTEGYRIGNTLASYIHIHFGSNPAAAGQFVDFAERKG